MKKLIAYTLCLISLGISFQSCKSNDKKLNAEVNEVIESKFTDVHSTVKDGVVTLTGVLNSEEERAFAENTVHAIKGVKDVVNKIIVKETGAPIVANPDETIKTHIESLLCEKGFGDVKVEVKDGEVRLSGNVKRADLQKVMEIAHESKPKKVINNIVLK